MQRMSRLGLAQTSFVRIQYHVPMIAKLLSPSQVPVKGCSNNRFICWLANNQLPLMWSHQHGVLPMVLMERNGVLPTTQFAYRKGLGTCDALLRLSHALQSALESGQEARIAQIDFRDVFDRVNHQGILYRLCFVGIGGSLLSILTQFLLNRSQHVIVDGC